MAEIVGTLLLEGIKELVDYLKKKRKNKHVKTADLHNIVINLSGHPLSKDAKTMLNPDFLLNIFPDVDMQEELSISLVRASSGIIKKILQSAEKNGFIEDILTGNYRIILPGFSSLAALVITELHAITGHFPPIISMKRIQHEFLPSEPIFLQDIRDSVRNTIRKRLE